MKLNSVNMRLLRSWSPGYNHYCLNFLFLYCKSFCSWFQLNIDVAIPYCSVFFYLVIALSCDIRVVFAVHCSVRISYSIPYTENAQINAMFLLMRQMSRSYYLNLVVDGLVGLLCLAFNNISVISWRSVLLVEETGENHRPVASHWQTLSHNVVNPTTMRSQLPLKFTV